MNHACFKNGSLVHSGILSLPYALEDVALTFNVRQFSMRCVIFTQIFVVLILARKVKFT